MNLLQIIIYVATVNGKVLKLLGAFTSRLESACLATVTGKFQLPIGQLTNIIHLLFLVPRKVYHILETWILTARYEHAYGTYLLYHKPSSSIICEANLAQ